MSLEDALTYDCAGDLGTAALFYEEVVSTGNASLESILNLAILYWQATDVGMAASKGLSPDFVAKAGRRFPQLLEEARRRFPGSLEVPFWQRYIAWADLGE